MTPTILAAHRTIIATGKASNFPKLSESAACQRFVDLKVKGLAPNVAGKLDAVQVLGRAA